MPKNGKATPHMPSFFTLLSGWVQQGVESFFATQRIVIDLFMRQNAVAMKSLREGLSDPTHSPVAIMTELAIEGTSSFIEAQRILLNLAAQENDLLMTGIKERVSPSTPAVAMTDLFRRTIETFIGMQQDFLKITSKQTIDWLEEARHGRYAGTHALDLAREGMQTFVTAQKKFLDIVAQETMRLTTKTERHPKPMKKTELAKLARDASTAFIEAQKKLLDVAGQQMNVNVKAASKTLEMLNPARLLPIANITGGGVRSFIDAEKNVIESMIKPAKATEHHGKRPARHRKTAPMAAHAVA